MFCSRLLLSFALVCLPTIVACGADKNEIPADVLTALEKADSLVLYSLDPSREPSGTDEDKKDADNKFHGWKVLGKTTVKDAKRGELIQALKKGVAENEGIVAACFIPRHGIRVEHDKHTFDIVICFQCYSANTFVGGERTKGFLVTGSPQPAFDAVLTAAKVPLPKGSKD